MKIIWKRVESTNLKEYLVILTLVTLEILLFFIFYSLFVPFTVIDVPKILNVMELKVKQGDTLGIRVKYCLNTDADVKITRSFRNVDTNEYYPIPPVTVSVKKGCQDFISRTIKIPDDMPPSIYEIVFNRTVEVNKLRTVKVDYKTERFEVMKK